MRVLLLGGGGREHALAWKLAQSPRLTKLYAAPGNPGVARHAELVGLDPVDGVAVAAWAVEHAIDLVVIGPEAPLVAGVADALRAAGVRVFGPSAAAARLEGSKAFTKRICREAGIPTARSREVEWPMDWHMACQELGYPVVIKSDGLAAGKGVHIAGSAEDAHEFLMPLRDNGGPELLVIEEFMAGEEASLFVLADGTDAIVLGAAGDHKRVGDGDTGPNTGGMGAFSPVPAMTPELEARAMDEIVLPTLRAMADAGTPFSGLLYAGLMLTADGPKLVEYNVRFGDPEAQALMLRLDEDLLDLTLATAEGRLGGRGPVRLADEASVAVVVAACGYPGTPATGGAIEGLDEAEAAGAVAFQAGTASRDGQLVASGGRVLSFAGRGATLSDAAAAAYRGVAQLRFADGFWRTDIGARAGVARPAQA